MSRSPIEFKHEMQAGSLKALAQRVQAAIIEENPFIDKSVLELLQSVLMQYFRGLLKAEECRLIFVRYLGSVNALSAILPTPTDSQSPRRPPGFWTADEDQKLLAAVRAFGENDWISVSRAVGRGRIDCSERWYRSENPMLSREPWTEKETKRLIKLVEEFGENQWKRVAAKMKKRCDFQCHFRYRMIMGFKDDATEAKVKGTKEFEDQQPRVTLPSISMFMGPLETEEYGFETPTVV